MMYKISIFLIALAAISMASVSTQSYVAPETLEVFAESEIQAKNLNFATAKERALQRAKEKAIIKAITALKNETSKYLDHEALNSYFMKNVNDYIIYYKLLEEIIDYENQLFILSTQITFDSAALKTGMNDRGFALKSTLLPKVLLIIDESKIGFIETDNFLLLASRSENIITQYFKDKNYQVFNRKDILGKDLDLSATLAIEGDLDASRKLLESVSADILIIGEVDTATVSNEGAMVTTTQIASSIISNKTTTATTVQQEGSNLYKETLQAEHENLDRAAGDLAIELLKKTASIWSKG
ncbi:MAG: hypothetical protein ACN4E2_01355 [Nitrospinota bacterium]